MKQADFLYLVLHEYPSLQNDSTNAVSRSELDERPCLYAIL